MPYIDAKVNVPVSSEKEESIKAKLGKAIAIVPGKSESWLMLNIQDGCRLYFRGSKKEPAAMVEVKLYGSASPDAYRKLTAEITKILEDELGISADHIYVKYEEIDTWGWNGSNF